MALRVLACTGVRRANQSAAAGLASSTSLGGVRQVTTPALAGKEGLKVTCVLYNGGEPARKEPRLLGTTENALGLRDWLKERGHMLVVTSDKEGENCELDKNLPDTDILITTPFWPAYVTAERLKKAPKLKLSLTAGIGSDHIDLIAASKAGLTVAEVTGSNTVSVTEHVVMMILSLVRNYMPAHKQVLDGRWDISEIAAKAFDLEGKTVGTIGAGRIGQLVLQRLGGFNCKELLYYDYGGLDAETEEKLKARRVMDMEELISQCEVVTINCPLHDGTRGMFNKELISKMKPGSYLVNTARGAICDTDAVTEALESGNLAGYAGDVWYPQPAPKDHPWRSMPNQAMTPHYSGTTLDAQARYAAGVKGILQATFDSGDLKPADIICKDGKLAPQYDKAAKQEDRNLKHAPGWEKQAEAQAKDKSAGKTLS